MRKRWRLAQAPARSWVLVMVLLGLFMPLFIRSPFIRHLLITAMIYAVVASNWDLSLGLGGVFNFAHTVFFAGGAYTAAMLAKVYGVSPWLTLAVAPMVVVALSALACIPVLRVKGLYICLVTFAFCRLVMQVVMSQSAYTGGSQGIVLIPPLRLGEYSLASDGRLGYYYTALVLLGVSCWYLYALARSNFGASVVALRDNEDYAISRGVCLWRQRLLTFMASAVFTGAAGAFYAIYVGMVSPQMFGFGFSSTFLSMILLGGIGTLWGPVLGAFVLTGVSETMTQLGPIRYLIVAALIVLVLRFYPDGMLALIRRRKPTGSRYRRLVQPSQGG